MHPGGRLGQCRDPPLHLQISRPVAVDLVDLIQDRRTGKGGIVPGDPETVHIHPAPRRALGHQPGQRRGAAGGVKGEIIQMRDTRPPGGLPPGADQFRIGGIAAQAQPRGRGEFPQSRRIPAEPMRAHAQQDDHRRIIGAAVAGDPLDQGDLFQRGLHRHGQHMR